METRDLPRLSVTGGIIAGALSLLSATGTFAAFLLADKTLETRLIVSASIAGVVIVGWPIWFLARLLLSCVRRVGDYPLALEALRAEQRRRAELQANVAAATGVALLQGGRLTRRNAGIQLVFGPGTNNTLAVSDVVLIVQEMDVLARGQVEEVKGGRVVAPITWFADPVAEGWFIQNLTPFGIDIPAGTVVISENALKERLEALVEQTRKRRKQ